MNETWDVKSSLEAYYKAHRHCPSCRSTRVVTTNRGILPDMKGGYVDRNDARCCDCGWIGIVHRMGGDDA